MKGLFILLVVFLGGIGILRLLEENPGLEHSKTFLLLLIGALFIFFFLIS
jgi:hypothetical protein